MEKLQRSSDTTSSLPLQEYEEIFRNLSTARRFAIDIGGSLTKIAYYSTVSHRRVTIRDSGIEGSSSEFEYENWENARLHFIKFETRVIEECLEFIRTHLVDMGVPRTTIKATGGGAYKYTQMIQEKLGLKVDKEDEMGCLIKGSNFLLKHVADEVFTYDRTRKNEEYRFQSPGPVVFPYLLVNIGSGVSILKVDGEEEFERVGGTATGGGTFWGLGSILCGEFRTFDELLALAEEGDHKKVDMLVKDIYSGDLRKLGLGEDTIASSFGKCVLGQNFNKSDLVRSLLFTIVNDIGQIASLYALKYGLKKIYFGGYFLRGHPVSMHAISFSVKYWSKGTVEGMFLRHEGYVGSIGAFLLGAEEVEDNSWGENYVGSSGLCQGSNFINKQMEHLEIDKLEPLGFFPLLRHPFDYVPDTVDLTVDSEARDYWLQCFSTWVDRVPSRAIESQPNQPTAVDRALMCRQKLLSIHNLLKNHPCAYGTLTVRSLLDTIEQTLSEYDFPDPYLVQKQLENNAGLQEFKQRIQFIDQLEDPMMELIEGLLAGNFFDWGAKEVTNMLEGPDHFGFKEAKSRLLPRPWLVDYVDVWIKRIKTNPHKCVAVFVDNSGFDFILGVVPFVRWFLSRGSKVILIANSSPALNDMTYKEMVPLLNQLATMCPIIKSSLETSQLIATSNGQGSPCLDLSRVNQELVKLIQEQRVDLCVIEGMGRAIHTNFNAEFKCDVLKCAVIKNKWLAERFGGEIFSVVFKYEEADNLST